MLSHSSSLKHRVLIVWNTNAAFSALSEQVADYYIAAHGLVEHKLGLDLGATMLMSTTDSDALLAGHLTTIANYCEANDIKIVLCSACVPEGAYSLVNSISLRSKLSFSSLVAAARMLKEMNVYPTRSEGSESIPLQSPTTDGATLTHTRIAPIMRNETPIGEPPSGTPYGTARNFTVRIPSWSDYRTAAVIPGNLTSLMMCGGRIGWPGNFAGWNGSAEGLTDPETWEDTKRIIDDAVAMEGTVNGPVHIGIYPYQSSVPADGSEYSRRLLHAYGFDVRHCIESTTGMSLVPPAATYSDTTMKAGTLSPKQPLWGIYGSNLRNLALDHPWVNSYEFQRGSWFYQWTSLGLQQGYQALKAGACCAMGAWYEPYASGLVPSVIMLRHLLRGLTATEASFAFGGTHLAWCFTVWGDPLYRPFANRKPPGGFSISEKDLQ
jgi:hypothetical protein